MNKLHADTRPPLSVGIWGSKDGENPLEKLKAVTRIGVNVGVTYGILHADHIKLQMRSHATVVHIIKSTFFCVGVGTIFMSSSFLSAKIRGKSDVYNTLIGGLCTLPVFRTVLSMHTLGAIAPFGLIILGSLRFLCDEEDRMKDHIFKPASFSLDCFTWVHNRPLGEPYIKYKSNDLFTILQKE